MSVTLFLITLTVDDWNLLAKYIEYIPPGQLRRSHLLKFCLVLLILPDLRVIALRGSGGAAISGILPDDAGVGLVLLYTGVSFRYLWTRQVVEVIQPWRAATNW